MRRPSVHVTGLLALTGLVLVPFGRNEGSLHGVLGIMPEHSIR